jgi:hypothetical protein
MLRKGCYISDIRGGIDLCVLALVGTAHRYENILHLGVLVQLGWYCYERDYFVLCVMTIEKNGQRVQHTQGYRVKQHERVIAAIWTAPRDGYRSRYVKLYNENSIECMPNHSIKKHA